MEKPIVEKRGNSTSIRFYTLDDQVEKNVRKEIKEIFQTKNKDDIQDVIYTCVKELMVNASKTNLKKTFFIEAKIDEKDKVIYEKAKKKVRKLMNEEYFTYLRSKLQKHNHDVKVNIEDKEQGIVITVENPLPMMRDEEVKVRALLQKAMNSNETDISLFYSDEDADSEGASLGLSMTVKLLEQIGINPALFRIGVIEGNTVARIEVPLSTEYRSVRKVD